MTLKKDSLKMNSFTQMGQQEGKGNVWCAPPNRARVYVLFGILSLQPPASVDLLHDQCLVRALSLTQMQRLCVR